MRIATLLALFVVSALASAQPGSPTLQVTNPADIAALRSLDMRINALSKLASECAEKKLAPPEFCFCKYPAELAALRKEYQSVITAHPPWTSRAVAWTDSSSGTPVGHSIAIANIGPQFNKCSAK